MPQPRYRIRLPDGQGFDVRATPARIRTAHPTATITHRVVHDGAGNAELVPYAGEQAAPEAPESGDEPKKALGPRAKKAD